eukprot:TRINITY_DN14725_c0_g1_i2.p1 TRINITY_DN14725_c0_g1~~TRINITY_DN14725_c0_g1_i2.p1  ORF type:complete len:198 (+),score=25.67 TRINITY_DN14725_c0_g1_i2:597-1190(+)
MEISAFRNFSDANHSSSLVMSNLTLDQFNALPKTSKIEHIQFIFEKSPWVVERALESDTYFTSTEALVEHLYSTLDRSQQIEKLSLLQAHPDLVGRAALEGTLTASSTQEQASAGLDRLSKEEIKFFQTNNERYKEKFSFPFIICVKLNKKESIAAAMPIRLQNSYEVEFQTAINEVKKIAKLRLSTVLHGGNLDIY